MFEKVVLKRSSEGLPPTIGDIAEALLFYKEVELIVNPATLVALVGALGRHHVATLFRRENVSVTYVEETLCVFKDNATRAHDFVAVKFSGGKETGKLRSRDVRLAYLLEQSGLTKGQALRFADQAFRVMNCRSVSGDHFVSGGIPSAARKDLDDPSFVGTAVRSAVVDNFGSEAIRPDFEFSIEKDDGGYVIETNLDFDSLNEGSDNPIHEAQIIQSILSANEDLLMSAFYGAEFRTSQLVSEIIKAKVFDLGRLSDDPRIELERLESALTVEAMSVREVINSGERSFDEFMLLLDEAQEFRDWIHKADSDADIVSEYIRELRSVGFLQKLPTKIARYFISTVVGSVHFPSGLALSAADSFLLDKLHQGWRPTRFVDNHFAPFVRSGA